MELFNVIENILTVFGALSVIKICIYFYLYLKEENNYEEIDLLYFYASDSNMEEKDYPIRDYFSLNNSNNDKKDIFLFGAKKHLLKNIKIYEVTDYQTDIFHKKGKLKLKKIKECSDIFPGEYLQIDCMVSEGIPNHIIKFRIEGKPVEYPFVYNGLYGNRSNSYIQTKHDVYSFLYTYFRQL